jgi:hypothetical protein
MSRRSLFSFLRVLACFVPGFLCFGECFPIRFPVLLAPIGIPGLGADWGAVSFFAADQHRSFLHKDRFSYACLEACQFLREVVIELRG